MAPQSQSLAIGSPSPTARHHDWEGSLKGDLHVLGAQSEPYREPLILRYFRLFWEQRWLVLGGSLLPALLVILVLYLWPRKYTATFCFERSLAQSEYNVRRRRFRSQENLDKIIGRLREHRHERRRATIPDGGPGSKSGVTALGIAD